MTQEQRAALRALATKTKANAPDWYLPDVAEDFARQNGGFAEDGPFIVAANPAAILSLLDALAAAEAERATLRADLDRARADAQRLREAMSDILNNTEAPNGRDETARFDLDAIWVRARAALAATTKDASDAE